MKTSSPSGGKAKALPQAEKRLVSIGLAIAEEMEAKAVSFYTGASRKKGVRADLKSIFVFLIKEEKNHLKVVKALEKVLKKQGYFKKLKIKGSGTPAKKIFRKGRDFSRAINSGELSLGLWALNTERLSKKFYESMEKKTRNRTAKRFFAQLASFEQRHFKLIDDALEQIAGTEGLFST